MDEGYPIFYAKVGPLPAITFLPIMRALIKQHLCNWPHCIKTPKQKRWVLCDFYYIL